MVCMFAWTMYQAAMTPSLNHIHPLSISELIVRMGVVVSCLGLILGSLSNSPHMIAAMSYDDVLPFLSFLREGNENDEPIKALWFTVLLVALPTLGGNLDRVSPYATIFYLLMYSGINLATCISGYVKVRKKIVIIIVSIKYLVKIKVHQTIHHCFPNSRQDFVPRSDTFTGAQALWDSFTVLDFHSA